MAEAHFLILPTRADCATMVFAEANAFGVPCLSTEVGGTGTLIRNGVNGQLFDPAAPARVWRDYILDLWSDSERYTELALSSFDEFAGRLNWRTACSAVADMLIDSVS